MQDTYRARGGGLYAFMSVTYRHKDRRAAPRGICFEDRRYRYDLRP